MESTPVLNRQNTFEISKAPDIFGGDNIDEGLYIIAKGRCDGVEIYAICEIDEMVKIIPKYQIDTDNINIDTVRIFPIRDRIYFSCTRDQRLFMKSWSFRRQTLADVLLPSTIQSVKPRLVNASGESIFVLEEKHLARCEGYKTIVYKFGLESEFYKCIEGNFGGMKEIIGVGDEVFLFNQRAEVFSFNIAGGKPTSRGTLNHNGILKAVIFHDNIYVGCYIRPKCTLFVELYKKRSNQWTTVSRYITPSDITN